MLWKEILGGKKYIWMIGVMILLGIGISTLIPKDTNKGIDSSQVLGEKKVEIKQEEAIYTLDIDGGLNPELIENRSFEQ